MVEGWNLESSQILPWLLKNSKIQVNDINIMQKSYTDSIYLSCTARTLRHVNKKYSIVLNFYYEAMFLNDHVAREL